MRFEMIGHSNNTLMKLSVRFIVGIVLILSSINCSSIRLVPNRFPEYPVEIRIYYDSRCEAEVILDESNTLFFKGEINSRGPTSAKLTDNNIKNAYGLGCWQLKNQSAEKLPWRHLDISIYFDRNLNQTEIDDYFTLGLLRNKPVADRALPALQRRDKALKLDVSKFVRSVKDFTFTTSENLPFNYLVVFDGYRANDAFPRTFRTPIHCGAIDVHSKSGTMIVEAIKDYQKNGLYMTIKGTVILGKGRCF